jgi:hypothetical protein
VGNGSGGLTNVDGSDECERQRMPCLSVMGGAYPVRIPDSNSPATRQGKDNKRATER